MPGSIRRKTKHVSSD